MLGLTSNGKCQAHMVRNRTPWFRSWGALAERVRTIGLVPGIVQWSEAAMQADLLV